MQLFHVSPKQYSIGQTIDLRGCETEYVQRLRSENKYWIEEVFEKGRPPSAPSRISSVFAFGIIEHCQAYDEIPSISRKGSAFYYSVEIEEPWPVPMALLGRLMRLGIGYSQTNEIVNEYWSPTIAWDCVEYIGKTMLITNILNVSTKYITTAKHEQYQDDLLYSEDKWK